MVRPKEIQGMTPTQIQQHLALPQVPTNITNVKVPAGTTMRTGKVAPQPQFGMPDKGGTQYHIEGKIPENNFYNSRPLK